MLQEVFEINNDGFIINNYVSYVIDGNISDSNLKHCISTIPQEGFYKPRWNGVEWTEGATREEIEELTRVEPSPPTELELLKQENLLLKAQVQANADRADFHEELIVELATLVIP